MSYTSPALMEIPDIVSPEDRDRLKFANTLDVATRMLLYQEMIDRYSSSQPFLLVRLGDMFVILKSGTLAINQYRKAQDILSSQGIVDSCLYRLVNEYAPKVDREVNEILAWSRGGTYYQKWKPTKTHNFPTNLPHLPSGSQEVKNRWQQLIQQSTFFENYLLKLAIETNHIESTFLLTEESSQDLIRHGISEGTINCLPESSVHDSCKIKSILNDTFAAYKLLAELCDKLEGLDRSTICRIHLCLMKTCQFGDHYTPVGKTRTETRKTVIISGAYKIECCPFPEVDGEVDYICRMVKQWIKSWRNPFATASWIHLVLGRCHPFEDGNGRLVRLIASIPLMRHGYPPISIPAINRGDYYGAITEAYRGNHEAFVQCFLKGMEETILSMQLL